MQGSARKFERCGYSLPIQARLLGCAGATETTTQADTRMSLLARWADIFAEMGLRGDPEVHAELRHAYSAPSRTCHNLHWLGERLAMFSEHRALAPHAQMLELAIWFHAAHGDVRRADNELRNAEWAQRTLIASGAEAGQAQRLHDLVLATIPQAELVDESQCLLIDVLTSIYGARPARYDEYERLRRQEYRHVPQSLYQSVRRKALRDLYNAPQLFFTPVFRERYERAARDNLERALRHLGAGVPARGPL